MNNIVFGTYSEILFNEKTLMPQPFNNYKPEWYKNMRPLIDKEAEFKYEKYLKSVKSCPSFHDIFEFGYVILAPIDYVINVNKDKSYEWKTPLKVAPDKDIPIIQDHNDNQMLDFWKSEEVKIILKINLPLKVFTPKGYSCYQLPVPYTQNNDVWEAAFGMLRTDKLHQVNIQILVKKFGEFVIKQGTPLAIYLPYKRNNLKLKYVNLNDNNKYRSIDKGKYLKQYGTFKGGVKNYYED